MNLAQRAIFNIAIKHGFERRIQKGDTAIYMVNSKTIDSINIWSNGDWSYVRHSTGALITSHGANLLDDILTREYYQN